MCCVLCWSAIPKHFRLASQKSQNQHQLISRPNLLFVETLRRTKFILILKHYGSLVFAVLSIAFCSSALCPDLPVSAYAAPWLNSFSGLQTDPQNLCAWALHIFFLLLYIDFCKETDQEWISFTDEIIRAVFFITLTPFFGHRCLQQFAHDASLSTESSKMWEELWLFNWLKGSWWRNINKPPHSHLIPFRFKISSMLVHLFGPSTFSKFNILIDTDIIQIFSPENSWEIDLVKLTKKNPQMHKPL